MVRVLITFIEFFLKNKQIKHFSSQTSQTLRTFADFSIILLTLSSRRHFMYNSKQFCKASEPIARAGSCWLFPENKLPLA